MRKAAVTWPDGKICNSCYYTATGYRGRCPRCGSERLLPGHVSASKTNPSATLCRRVLPGLSHSRIIAELGQDKVAVATPQICRAASS
jgi:hypothetical protein